MIALEVYAKLTETKLSEFKDKPTSLTQGQKEASTLLWSSEDGHCKIGVWECQPGHFTADRRAAGEYCHILSGRASPMSMLHGKAVARWQLMRSRCVVVNTGLKAKSELSPVASKGPGLVETSSGPPRWV